MQLISLFTLLPLLAAVASATSQASTSAAAPAEQHSYGEQVVMASAQHDNDDGDYHDEPVDASANYKVVDDDRVYNKVKDSRKEDDRFAPVSPRQTVIIVVAKSQHTRTTTHTIFTSGSKASASANATSSATATAQDDAEDSTDANNTGDSSASSTKVQYTSPSGRPLTPATASFMFPINRTIALRNNYKENRHLRKNKLYPKHSKCLTVRRHGLRQRFRAVLEHCNDDQRFWLRSPMSFHFEDAGDDTVVLTWMDPKGLKRCAHHDVSGTRFYPCNGKKKPTRYDILPTKYDGKFKIKQHSRNRCMDFDHDTMWMNRCRRYNDQALDVITVAMDKN